MSDNPYQLTFELKQHTPIIHFQHDQAGATLRATEVKPKLDRFILNDLKDLVGCEFFNKHESYFNSQYFSDRVDKRPSTYKVSCSGTLKKNYLLFSGQGNIEEKLICDHNVAKSIFKNQFDVIGITPYFANNKYLKIGKDTNKKKFIKEETEWSKMIPSQMYTEIILEFRSFHKPVVDIIRRAIPLLISLENFGTRQSKGFGSFSVDKINGEKYQENVDEHFERLSKIDRVKEIYVKKRGFDKGPKEDLKNITNEWKAIKAGSSYPEYVKSDLMKFFLQKYKIRWEKRFIKNQIKNEYNEVWKILRRKHEKFDGDDNVETGEKYQYVRALLGLAKHNEYGTWASEDSIMIEIDDELSSEEKTKHLAVERFASPIRYKITEDKIYMIVFKIPDELFTKTNRKSRHFSFKLKTKIDGKENENKLGTLVIPSDVDVKCFLDSRKLKNNLTPHVSGNSIAEFYGYTKV